jgi:hypothetical protein
MYGLQLLLRIHCNVTNTDRAMPEAVLRMTPERPNEIRLNRISNDDRDSIEFVRSRLKHTDSILE